MGNSRKGFPITLTRHSAILAGQRSSRVGAQCEAVGSVCRSIKVLRKPGQVATPEELSSAALQFVRKISGFHKPSRANQEAFERAVLEITNSSDRLLKALGDSLLKNRQPSEVPAGNKTKSAAN
jgi:hypothetical protein